MAAPYLVEIRPSETVKKPVRTVMYDVADEFDVNAAVSPRPVPHITLFGPYNTSYGRQAKERIKTVCGRYDLLPYRINGFGRFPDSQVIYADVIPSPALRSFRRELSDRLREISYNYPDYDTDPFHRFHITIAFKDVGRQFDDIWAYVNDTYDLEIDAYATRVTSLRRRNMMWEYDLLQDRELRPDEAMSAASWQRTEALLEERASGDDHANLSPYPGWWTRFKYRLVNWYDEISPTSSTASSSQAW